jgi:hypothetical protein
MSIVDFHIPPTASCARAVDRAIILAPLDDSIGIGAVDACPTRRLPFSAYCPNRFLGVFGGQVLKLDIVVPQVRYFRFENLALLHC